MTAQDAAVRVMRRLTEFNRSQRSMWLPELHDTDMTWPARRTELGMRVASLGVGRTDRRPSMSELEAVGAWVLASMMALDAAEEVDVSSGDEEERAA